MDTQNDNIRPNGLVPSFHTWVRNEDVFFDKLNTERLDATCAAPGGSATFGTSKTNQVCSLVDKASVSCATEMLPAGDFADAVAAADTNKEE